MSSANVLPSAPAKLYPELPTQPDFRMQKVNEISSALKKKSATIELLRKNINGPRKLSTGALLAPAFFQQHFQVRVLAPLFLLSVFRLQSHLAASVGLSLSLVLG